MNNPKYESDIFVAMDTQEVLNMAWESKIVACSPRSIPAGMDKLKELVFSGVPCERRGEIWKFLAAQLLLEDKATLSNTSSVLFQQLSETFSSSANSHQILTDLHRICSDYPAFATPRAQMNVYQVLKVYSVIDPAIGYCQGMGPFALVLLNNKLVPHEAFRCFKVLMYTHQFRHLFDANLSGTDRLRYQLRRFMFQVASPELWEVFTKDRAIVKPVVCRWMLTAFLSSAPFELVERIFDFIFVEGLLAVVRFTLAILVHYEKRLIESKDINRFNILETALKQMKPSEMRAVVRRAVAMEITGSQFEQFGAEYDALAAKCAESSVMSVRDGLVGTDAKRSVQVLKCAAKGMKGRSMRLGLGLKHLVEIGWEIEHPDDLRDLFGYIGEIDSWVGKSEKVVLSQSVAPSSNAVVPNNV